MDVAGSHVVVHQLRIKTGMCVANAVGVEACTGADGAIYGIPYGVANCDVDNQIMEASRDGVAQILGINTLIVVRRVIHTADGDTAQMAVGVDEIAFADIAAEGVAESVVHSEVDDKIAEITRYRVTEILGVNALQVIGRVVDSAHRHTAEMAVGVKGGTGADGVANGVANSVVYNDVDNQVVETACSRIAQILCVNALVVVRRIIGPAHGRQSQMSVGIDTFSGTYGSSKGVAKGVVYSEVDDEILETAEGGVAQILGENACGVVRWVVVAAHRNAAQMAVGVDNLSGTDGAVDCVAKGVANGQTDIQHTVASANGKQRLIVHTGTRQSVAILDKGISRTYFGCNVAI